MHVLGYKLPALSSLILWALLWEVIGQLELTFFVPPISEVFVTLFGLLPTPAFLNALGVTAYTFVAGVFFAIVIGIPVGIMMGKSRILDELLLPWVNIFSVATTREPVPMLIPVGSSVSCAPVAPTWRTFWYMRSSKATRPRLKPVVLTLARLLAVTAMRVCCASSPVFAAQSAESMIEPQW
mgnify:CR=1 FL=1